MNKVEMYTTGHCPYCVRAKALLDARGIEYEERRIDQDPLLAEEMAARTTGRTVPQIFIDGESIGGYDDLVRHDHMAA